MAMKMVSHNEISNFESFDLRLPHLWPTLKNFIIGAVSFMVKVMVNLCLSNFVRLLKLGIRYYSDTSK